MRNAFAVAQNLYFAANWMMRGLRAVAVILPNAGAGHWIQKRWIAIAQTGVGIRELRRVRQVEELRPEPEAARLLHRKYPLDRHVEVVLPGPRTMPTPLLPKS